jgi:hypothetical protein
MTVYDIVEIVAHFSLKDKDSTLYNELAGQRAREIAADFQRKYGKKN